MTPWFRYTAPSLKLALVAALLTGGCKDPSIVGKAVFPVDLKPVEASGLKADILRGVEKDHKKELDKIKKIEAKIKKQQELITQVQALATCEFNNRLIHDTRDKIKDLKNQRIKAIKAADAVVELYADINNGKIGGM